MGGYYCSKRNSAVFGANARNDVNIANFWAVSNARNPLVCAKNGRLHAAVRADLPLTTLFAESAHARRVAAPQAPGETNTDENENY